MPFDDERETPVKSKPGVKKRYSIEYKRVAVRGWGFGVWDGKWHTWSNYADVGARDQALKSLQRKYPAYTYRPKEDNGISG